MKARKANSLDEVATVINQEIKQCAENIKVILENLPIEQRNKLIKLADSMKVSQISTSQFDVEAIYRELNLCIQISCKTHLISSALKEQLITCI